MTIANTLSNFIDSKNLPYELIKHRPSDTAYNTAAASHLPSECVSKAVVLEDENNTKLMAVIPAGYRLALEQVNQLKGKQYHLLMEDELAAIFADCEQGATPALGEAYGMDTLVDERLLEQDRIYIEAGDHRHLLGFDQEVFMAMTKTMPFACITGRAIGFQRAAERMNTEWLLS